MPMSYERTAIADSEVPPSAESGFQHVIDTYASEINKVYSVWSSFPPEALSFRPHVKSSTVGGIMEHQLLSERRFFSEFVGLAEPPVIQVLPVERTLESYSRRLVELARPRLHFLAGQRGAWWQERVRFFDVERERIWVFWRRILHTAHHRTQLTVYLRLMDQAVLPTYGPTADFTWQGADPTLTVESASRSEKAEK